MSALAAMFVARFTALLQYRAAALAGFATQVFWGFVHIGVFSAFYRASTAAQPMTIDEVVTYVWLTQALLMLLPWRFDAEIEAMVRSGGFVYELVRPVDVYLLWYGRALAQRTAPALLRCVPLMLFAGALFGLRPPASTFDALAFLVSVTAAVLLSSSMTALLSVSLLFTISGKGTHMLSNALVNVFSGVLVPIPLVPDALATIGRVLPFRGLLDTPLSIWLGRLDGAHVIAGITHQLLWTAILIALGRWLLARAARRITVQGG